MKGLTCNVWGRVCVCVCVSHAHLSFSVHVYKCERVGYVGVTSPFWLFLLSCNGHWILFYINPNHGAWKKKRNIVKLPLKLVFVSISPLSLCVCVSFALPAWSNPLEKGLELFLAPPPPTNTFFFPSKIFLISIKKNTWMLQLKLMCPKAYNFHVQW